DDLLSLQPRPGGAGFEKHRKWRWQPLLEAYSAEGDYRGTVAALIICLQQPQPSALAAFTPSNTAFYAKPQVQQVVQDAATALSRGLFLAEGGARFYTHFPDEPVVFGASAVRLGNLPPGAQTVRHFIEGEPA